jgi:hypothetical protein
MSDCQKRRLVEKQIEISQMRNVNMRDLAIKAKNIALELKLDDPVNTKLLIKEMWKCVNNSIQREADYDFNMQKEYKHFLNQYELEYGEPLNCKK